MDSPQSELIEMSSRASDEVDAAPKRWATNTNPLYPRLLARDLPFHQSSGKFKGLVREDSRFLWWEARRPRSWSQLIISMPTTKFILVLMVLYTVMVLFFALILLAVNEGDCPLEGPGGPLSFVHAQLARSKCVTLMPVVRARRVCMCR